MLEAAPTRRSARDRNLFNSWSLASGPAVPNLLQYLGTFSRELNAPTWQSATNPISQRFQLDKISLLNPTPPTSTQAVDIKTYFGLQWSTTTNRWQYVGTQGSSLLDAIPTPAPNGSPPPDFFQILNYAYSIPGPTPRLIKFYRLALRLSISTTPIKLLRGSTMRRHRLSPGGRSVGRAALQLRRWVHPAHHPCQRQLRGYSPILQQPFQSVGELGYAYNPITGQTLDFKTSGSPAAALLDLFTYNTTDNTATYNLPYPLRAGPVNINTRNSGVIAALIKGAFPSWPPTTAGVPSSSATPAATLIASRDQLTQPAY